MPIVEPADTAATGRFFNAADQPEAGRRFLLGGRFERVLQVFVCGSGRNVQLRVLSGGCSGAIVYRAYSRASGWGPPKDLDGVTEN